MQLAGFNSTAFLAWAKRQDVLITDGGRRTKNTRIAGRVLNSVCIRSTTSDGDFDQIDDGDIDELPL
jgi:hypothetical protein